MYRVVYSKKAKKRISKLDASVRRKIKFWIENNLEGCDNPRLHGKALAGKYDGLWRYRVGSYRIIANIRDDEVLVIIIDAGHRREVYSKGGE